MKKLMSKGILLLLVFVLTCSSVLVLAEENIATNASTTEQTLEKAAVKLKKVQIIPKTFTLAPKKTKKLTLKFTPAKAKPYKTKEWTSSNPKVASVDKNGKVTAKKAGVAVISYATYDDDNYVRSNEAICYVSKTASKAKKLTAADLKFTVKKNKVFKATMTYKQVKKLLSKGKLYQIPAYESRLGVAMILYEVNEGEFMFTKSDGKLASALMNCNAPRGINAKSTAKDLIAKYGFPTRIAGGYEECEYQYDIKVGKTTYTLALVLYKQKVVTFRVALKELGGMLGV